jgi:AcrR family transcriptional regulator
MAQDAEPRPDSSWQQRAVDRSLGTARARAVSRSGQILAAARALLEETGGIEFTVQDIVDRSGLSLRSFYKHFGGKDELLLALFEERLRAFADDLRGDVEAHDDPIDRLRAYVTGFYRRAYLSSAHGGRAFSSYHVRMLEARHDEFAVALAPQVELLREIVEMGVAADRVRTDLTPRELTGLLTVTLMAAAQMSLLDVHLMDAPLESDRLWAWCSAAVGCRPPTD